MIDESALMVIAHSLTTWKMTMMQELRHQHQQSADQPGNTWATWLTTVSSQDKHIMSCRVMWQYGFWLDGGTKACSKETSTFQSSASGASKPAELVYMGRPRGSKEDHQCEFHTGSTWRSAQSDLLFVEDCGESSHNDVDLSPSWVPSVFCG